VRRNIVSTDAGEDGDERALPVRIPAALAATLLRHRFELDDGIALCVEQHGQRIAILFDEEGVAIFGEWEIVHRRVYVGLFAL
jgi:hypothetical protein